MASRSYVADHPAPRTARRRRARAGGAALLTTALALAALVGCRSGGNGDTAGGAADAGGQPAAVSGTLAAGADAAAAAVAGEGAGVGASAPGPGPTPTVAERLTAEDEAAMVELIRSLFASATGAATADMQDVVVRQLTTMQLRQLRGDAGPSDGAIGYTAGYVWLVAFTTGAPITVATFMPDPASMADLRDVDPDASLASADGRTTVYYVVATQSIEGRRRFVPMSQGILVEGRSKWSLDDLRAVPTP